MLNIQTIQASATLALNSLLNQQSTHTDILETYGFEGSDASLDISLFEYGMIWLDMPDQTVFVVWNGEENREFGECEVHWLSESDIEDYRNDESLLKTLLSECESFTREYIASMSIGYFVDFVKFQVGSYNFFHSSNYEIMVNDPTETFLKDSSVNCCTLKRKWVAGWNMAGFLPEVTPSIHDSFDEAKRDTTYQVKLWEEHADSESEAEHWCSLAEDMNLEQGVSGEFSVVSNGVCFFVAIADSDEWVNREVFHRLCDCCGQDVCGNQYPVEGFNPTTKEIDDLGEICQDCYESLCS